MSHAPKHATEVFTGSVLAGSQHGAFWMAGADGDRHGGGKGSPRHEPGPVIPRIPQPRPASE